MRVSRAWNGHPENSFAITPRLEMEIAFALSVWFYTSQSTQSLRFKQSRCHEAVFSSDENYVLDGLLNQKVISMRRSYLKQLLLLVAAGIASIASHASAQDIQVVHPTNTVWTYNDSSISTDNPTIAPGTFWNDPAYVPVIGTGINQWKTGGRGLFGNDTSPSYTSYFGTAGNGFRTPLTRSTAVPAGTDSSRVTFYFITKFNWPYTPAGVILRGTNWLDDGGVVYLNGVEVFRARQNGTPGTIPAWDETAVNQGAEGVPEPLEYAATSLVTGENTLAVEVHQSSTASSDLAFTTSLRAVIPFAPTITTPSEPADRAVVQNRSATLAVTGDGSPRPTYQWYKDGAAIDGATTASYTIANMQSDTAGIYKVTLNNEFGSITSREANVTYVADVEPPVVVSASADVSFVSVILRFDEVITEGSAVDPFGYEVVGGPNLPGIASVTFLSDGKTVVLGLNEKLQEDTIYTLAVKSPTDLVGLTIADGTTATFRTLKVVPGVLTFETYNTPESGVEVAKLKSSPSFPYNPRETFYIRSFDTREAYPNDSHEQYGGRLDGVFIPPTSGNWIFYLRSDDASELWMDFNDGAGLVLVQSESGCCGTFSGHATAPAALVAGTAYHIQALYKEGGGGDYCQVAAKLDTDPIDPNNLTPIPATSLGTYLSPSANPNITITQNPTSQVAAKSTPAQAVGLVDFNSSGAGFTVSTPNAFMGTPWAYNAGAGSWQVNQLDAENGVANTTFLLSPSLSVVQSGVLNVSLIHRWSLETANWDGCGLQISVNGGAFTTVPNSAFSAGGYNGVVVAGNSVLTGQEAWVLDSPNHQDPGYVTSVAGLGTLNAGDTVQLRFVYAGDTNTKGPFQPSWEINSVEFSPALESNYADGTVTFTTLAEATLNSAPTPVAYQWQRNNGAGFFDIPRATSSSYSLLPTPSDSGAIFRCIVRSPGAEATSSEATLIVAPKQTITLTGNTAVISWPAVSTGFALEQASALLTPATTVWTPVGIAPSVSGGMNTVTITGAGAGQKFYRLKK